MIPQRLHPGGESVYTSYISPVYDTSKVTPGGKKVFVPLIFRQFIRPRRLQPSGESVCISYIPTVCETSKITPGGESVCTSYFRQFIRPQRLQPSGESVCNNDEEDFASS